MSRIGKLAIAVPAGVKATIADRLVTVEGPLGKLTWEFPVEIEVALDEEAKNVVVTRNCETRDARAFHGLSRALIQNMVVGVTQGYEKRLELQGVGYIAAIQNGELQLRVGLANELQRKIPEGLDVACPDQQRVIIKGIDKQQVGQFAAEIRALRKAEPYKGKGIRYEGEVVRRKQGKVMAK